MSMWQVVEKTDYGTDWHLVKYDLDTLDRLRSKEEGVEAAKKYLTKINCDNALTKEEKRNGIEAFMMLDGKVFLGVLDGSQWYLTDKKTKEVITSQKHFELEGKTQIDVREVRGT